MGELGDLPQMLILYVIFLFIVTLHEAAHALAAKLSGDLTAYHEGQVTLDPLPHIRREPIGMVVAPILFLIMSSWPFGWASCPVDRHWTVTHPKKSAIVSLAGPLTHLVLLLLAVVLVWGGVVGGKFDLMSYREWVTGAFHSSGRVSVLTQLVLPTADSNLWKGIAEITSMFIFLNLVFFLFNALPFPPMDGSHALTFFMNSETTARYYDMLANPMVTLIGIMAGWRMISFLILESIPVLWGHVLYPGWLFG